EEPQAETRGRGKGRKRRGGDDFEDDEEEARRAEQSVTPRGRVALIAVGVTVGILVLFIGTVLILMNAVSDDGLGAGGPRVAVVEIEGIIVDGSSAVRELREHLENPAVKAVILRVNSPGGVVAPTQEIFAAIQRVRKGGKPVIASFGAVAASGGY